MPFTSIHANLEMMMHGKLLRRLLPLRLIEFATIQALLHGHGCCIREAPVPGNMAIGNKKLRYLIHEQELLDLPNTALAVDVFITRLLSSEATVLTFPAIWWRQSAFQEIITERLNPKYMKGPGGQHAVWFLSFSPWNKRSAPYSTSKSEWQT